MSSTEELRFLLLGLLLLYGAEAVCPRPIFNTTITDDSQCAVRFNSGCKLSLRCNPGKIPDSSNFPNMEINEILCGDDDHWRDASGKVLDPNKPGSFLKCIPGCAVPNPVTRALYKVVQTTEPTYQFKDPRNNYTLYSYVPINGNVTIRCVGDRVGIQNSNGKVASHSYQCVGGNNFEQYSTGDKNVRKMQDACRYYCHYDYTNKQGMVTYMFNNGDRTKVPDGYTVSTTCVPGTVWQSKTNPASYGTEELICNGTLNKFTDTRTGQITRVAACITPVPSGECYKPNTTFLEVLLSNCSETFTGITANCSMTINVGYMPTDQQYYTPSGSQNLTCLKNEGWVDDNGNYTNPIQCMKGCVKEVDYVSDIPSYSQGPVYQSICTNITYYKGPPPEHPYYCSRINTTANCTYVCYMPEILPEGVRITPGTFNITMQNPNAWAVYSGHYVHYSCMSGYQYPSGSDPTLYGNEQLFFCQLDQYPIWVDYNTKVVNPQILACEPAGCNALAQQANVVLSNNSKIQLSSNSYKQGHYVKYDCIPGYSPVDMIYALADGQELTCNSSKWFSELINSTVSQTMACKPGCTNINVTQLATFMNNTFHFFGVTLYTDTSGASHVCISNYEKFNEIVGRLVTSQNKYLCNLNSTIEKIKQNLTITYSCPGSCLALDTSNLPANVILFSTPPTFKTDSKSIYVGQNTSYVFKCANGTHVPEHPPSYMQSLMCDTFYINHETKQVITNFKADDILPCIPNSNCPLKFASNVEYKTSCPIRNGSVGYNCNVTLQCQSGFVAVNISFGNGYKRAYSCSMDRWGNATWIDITTGQPISSLNCTPEPCSTPRSTVTVDVTRSCMHTDGAVVTNCTVVEKCKPGFFPVDVTGMKNGQRDSVCNSSKNRNGILINIVVGKSLPPLQCTPAQVCIISNTSTSYYTTTNCIVTNGAVQVGCNVVEVCRAGFFPINITAGNKDKRTLVCNSTIYGNATFIDIMTGIPADLSKCAPGCFINPASGTHINSTCTAIKEGYHVGCNASLVCDDGLIPINTTTGLDHVDMQCRNTGINQSQFIDITVNQPAQLLICGCPDPAVNSSTKFSSTCFQSDVGGLPGCNVTATCAPGNEPIWGDQGENSTTTITCTKNPNTKSYRWINIALGLPYKPNCAPLCKNISVSHAHWSSTCPYIVNNIYSGYQTNCSAMIECDLGYIGNAKYNYSSIVNVQCTNLKNNTSIFLETKTGKPVQDFCVLKCNPINITNVNISSNCYINGVGAPENCTLNATCIPGTYPIWLGTGINSTNHVNCTKIAGTDNTTWIDTTVGGPYVLKNCFPPCLWDNLTGTTFNTTCVAVSSGGYQVKCGAILTCAPGYTPIDIGSGVKAEYNVVCKNINQQNSTFVDIKTGQSISRNPCAMKTATVRSLTCDPIPRDKTVTVESTCYIQDAGSPLGCDATIKCSKGLYPVIANTNQKFTTNINCVKTSTDSATWIDISTRQPYIGTNCTLPCPPINLNGTIFNSTCTALPDGAYQVGCNGTLKCGQGDTPVKIGVTLNDTKNLQCVSIGSINSTFIDISTGQSLIKGPCEIVITPRIIKTLLPKCVLNQWYNMVNISASNCNDAQDQPQLTQSGLSQYFYSNCNITAYCINDYIPSALGYNTSTPFHIYCNKSIGTDHWIVVETGKIYTDPLCIPQTTSKTANISTITPVFGCPELSPPSGSIHVNESCTTEAPYPIGCRKQINHLDGTGITSQRQNITYECQLKDGRPQWVNSFTNDFIPINCSTKSGCAPVLQPVVATNNMHNGTCPHLTVKLPLTIAKKPYPSVYNHLVLIGGTYVVICPAGKQYNETRNSIRQYVCDQNGKYSSENATDLLEAIDTCVYVTNTTSNCSLTLKPGVMIKYSTCPNNGPYETSCFIKLQCQPGWNPKIRNKQEQNQFCKHGQDEVYWIDMEKDNKATDYECEQGCMDASTVKRHMSCKVEQIRRQNVLCSIIYVPPKYIDLLCDNTTVTNRTTGEISRACRNTCNQLTMDKGMNYVLHSPELVFGNLVLVSDYYIVQCPIGMVFSDTLNSTKQLICSQDGKYNTSTQRGITTVYNLCINQTIVSTATPRPISKSEDADNKATRGS